MANTLLTPTVILREAGRLFHQSARFISSIDRQYDNRYAQQGAKVGDTIALRDPVRFTTTDGATLNIQNATETSQNLTLGTRKHIGFSFSAQELTLTVDDFSERYLKKGIAQLAATCESDVLTRAWKATPNMIDGDAASFAFTHVAQAKQRLDEGLAPDDGTRSLLLCPTHSTKYLVDTKGLFLPQQKVSGQYNDGVVKDALGFNMMSSTHLTNFSTDTAAKVTGYLANAATAQVGASIITDTGTTKLVAGDVVTFGTLGGADQVLDVHPETKNSLGRLKQFTVTADGGASCLLLKISPSVVATGAYQNVSQAIPDNAAVTKVGAGASETLVQSLAYHGDAFCFATADLEDPSKYGQWGATQNMDGLSMRIWRSADIINDQFPCRIDVFYGFLARYPNLATRIHADG